MKINHQKIKNTSINNSIIKNLQTESRLLCAPVRCNCNCQTKISLINDQISRINSRITFILKLIQISKYDSQEGHNKSQSQTKNHSQFIKPQYRKQKSEESFLLDGIQSQISKSGIVEYPECVKANQSNLFIGKEVTRLGKKLKEYEEKWQQSSKIKNNLSLLTKIVQHMEQRFENSQKLIKKLNNIVTFRQKLASNCSMQSVQNNQGQFKIKKLKQKIANLTFSPIPYNKMTKSASFNIEQDKMCQRKKNGQGDDKQKQ